jgi:DNA-binding NarL/FixJ family response regulator
MGVIMPLKVLIADDHPLVRQAMRLVFDDHGSECEFFEADGLDPALELLAAHEVDLLLMDLGMPGMAGAESLRALREAYPDTKIAVITGQDDRSTILECLSAGIHGYILKASPIEEIMQAMTSILAGHVYVTPALARFASLQRATVHDAEPIQLSASASAAHGLLPPPKLTKRQVEVLRLLGQGQPTKQIARGLDLGIGTVKIHLAAVFKALNAKNRTEAALMATRYNL